MIVVSDTSPLNYLVLVGAIDVLPKLFGEVYVPLAVIQELQHPRTPEPVKQWAQSPPEWLRISEPSAAAPSAMGLDPGEAQAIALALEIHADAVLIDETFGRRFAKSQGLATFGTITVLELAAELDLVDLRVAFESLQRTTFHITQDLLDAALERDAARKARGG